MRAFIAIPLDETATQQVMGLQDALRGREWPPHHRFVPPGNLHLTLKFLGEINQEQCQQLVERFRRASGQMPSFDVISDQLYGFPLPQRMRNLVLLYHNNPQLSAVAERASYMAEQIGVGRETLIFRPHVTLLRLRQGVALDLSGVSVPQIRLSVERVVLYESLPGESAPVYRELASFHLFRQPAQ